MTTDELVVLLDDDGHAIGTGPKATTHHADTPLHLAFSCYVFDDEGRLLVTRRALGKPTWPGVWTNSVCGHPGPGEPLADAVARRARRELGLELRDVQLVLPAFRYTALMTNGVRENELCPVLVARAAGNPDPAPDEVEEWTWVPWKEFRDDVLDDRREVSPWCVEQIRELTQVELPDGSFAKADRGLLPAAVR
jgi:isopentenyl-diphosphate delta-isomerase